MFFEFSWNYEYFGSLAKLSEATGASLNFARDRKYKGLHLTLQETRSIHDSLNIPKIELIY